MSETEKSAKEVTGCPYSGLRVVTLRLFGYYLILWEFTPLMDLEMGRLFWIIQVGLIYEPGELQSEEEGGPERRNGDGL